MSKFKIAAEWAVFITDIVLGIVLASLLITNLINLSKSEIFQKDGTPEYILSSIEREDYGSAGIESRKMRLGIKIDEPMQEFYKVGSYADLMFWERIYAESGSEDTAEDCRKLCDEIRSTLPEYEKVYDKIDGTLEKSVTK